VKGFLRPSNAKRSYMDDHMKHENKLKLTNCQLNSFISYLKKAKGILLEQS